MIDYVCYVDTDSVVGDTNININGIETTIEDFFHECNGKYILEDWFNKDFVKECKGYKTISYDNNDIVDDDVVYVMKHKIRKKMFLIKCGDESVEVTEDHSIIVERNGKLIDVSPYDIKKEDKIIVIV